MRDPLAIRGTEGPEFLRLHAVAAAPVPAVIVNVRQQGVGAPGKLQGSISGTPPNGKSIKL